MPARNCARPPNTAANGNRNSPDRLVPYQPARVAATMNVAAAKPYRPRIAGGAIGWTTNRVRSSIDELGEDAGAGAAGDGELPFDGAWRMKGLRRMVDKVTSSEE